MDKKSCESITKMLNKFNDRIGELEDEVRWLKRGKLDRPDVWEKRDQFFRPKYRGVGNG